MAENESSERQPAELLLELQRSGHWLGEIITALLGCYAVEKNRPRWVSVELLITGGKEPCQPFAGFLTPDQAAEVLKVSRATVLKSIRDGELPVVKFGRRSAKGVLTVDGRRWRLPAGPVDNKFHHTGIYCPKLGTRQTRRAVDVPRPGLSCISGVFGALQNQ